jgi:hypothetical protein
VSLRGVVVAVVGCAAVVVSGLVPRVAAAQPSPFSPAPTTNPEPATPPPPKGPPVPEPPPGTDTTTSASPPVADAVAPPRSSSTSGKTAAMGEPEPGGGPSEPESPEVRHVALGAGGHVAFGAAPAVSIGARVSAEVATGRWSLGLEARYDLFAGAHTTPGASVRSTLAGGAFVPCMRARGTWACGVVLVSRVASEGAEADAPVVRDVSLLVGLGGRLAMHVPLPLNFALRIAAEVLAHPVPYELTANGHRLFRSSVVSTSIGPALVRAF